MASHGKLRAAGLAFLAVAIGLLVRAHRQGSQAAEVRVYAPQD